MKEIQKELNLTYLFIAHDLSVVQYMSDRIMVMYLGKIVEVADSKALYDEPLHPYQHRHGRWSRYQDRPRWT